MPKMIDIGKFKDAIAGLAPSDLNATPAVRFATVGEPVAATGSRTFTFVFSDESVDRYGDVIFARGWDLKNFNANPIALFGHDAATVENVIGRAKNVRVEGSALIGDIEFMGAEVNPNAEAVYQMVKGGFLKTVSVGFQPLEWELAKDKSRPQGVNFKKQELLEISIVPIPANANALVQAKADGIAIERLGLSIPPHATPDVIASPSPSEDGRSDERPVAKQSSPAAAPKIAKKGLYSVSFLASILADLGYLQDSVAWEAEQEGDDSPVPQALLDAMKQLGQVLIDMTAEEVAELLAGDEDDADEGQFYALSAPDARARLLRHVAKLDPGQLTALGVFARDLALGLTLRVKVGPGPWVKRAGKAISAANEKCLRAAHASITEAATAIMSVVEPDDDEPAANNDDGDSEKAAADMRRRKAAALRRKQALGA